MELAVILALRGPVKFSEEYATTTKQWDKIWITKKNEIQKNCIVYLIQYIFRNNFGFGSEWASAGNKNILKMFVDSIKLGKHCGFP